MGDSIADLERRFEADPENPQLASQVMAARTRAHWIFQEKSLPEWTVELQSKSWERVTEALSTLSELGLLCVDLWPQITQSITDTETAEPDGSLGYSTAKIASFLACLSKGFTDRQETLCDWLEQFQDKEATQAIRGNIASLALCELAQCSSMSPNALFDAQFWVLSNDRAPQYALNEGLRRLFIAKGHDAKFQKEVQKHLEHPKKQISNFQSRTWAQWSEELRSEDSDRAFSAIDQLRWASFYSRRLWPEIYEALDRAFEENNPDFYDLAFDPSYAEWLASLIADDPKKIRAVRRWIDEYSSASKPQNQVAVLALKALTCFAPRDSALRKSIVEAFQRSGDAEFGDLDFQGSYYQSVPQLFPEAQASLEKVRAASEVTRDCESTMGEQASVALSYFELSDMQFWFLLTLTNEADHRQGREAAEIAVKNQIKKDPERLTRLPRFLSDLYSEEAYQDPLLYELKALEQPWLWLKIPFSELLELYAKGWAAQLRIREDVPQVLCQKLKERLEAFSSLKEIQGFIENTELSPGQREAASILSLAFVDDETERLQKAESIPKELQGQLLEKVLDSLKNS